MASGPQTQGREGKQALQVLPGVFLGRYGIRKAQAEVFTPADQSTVRAPEGGEDCSVIQQKGHGKKLLSSFAVQYGFDAGHSNLSKAAGDGQNRQQFLVIRSGKAGGKLVIDQLRGHI